MSSPNNIFEIRAPDADAIINGMNAVIATSKVNTSKANKTPAIGALKAPPIPAATPHASNNVLSFWPNR